MTIEHVQQVSFEKLHHVFLQQIGGRHDLRLLQEKVLLVKSNIAITTILTLTIFYALWYATRFLLVLPMADSRKAKLLPYNIPFLGNSLAFCRNPTRLVNKAIHEILRSRDVFALCILGQTWYVVTGLQDIGPVYSDGHSFKFDTFLDSTLIAFGIDKSSLKLAWLKPTPEDACYRDFNAVNPKQKPFLDWIRETYRKALLPGKHMDVILDVYDGYVVKKITALDLSIGTRDLSLKDLVRTMMGEAIIGSLFGGAVFEIESDLITHTNGFTDDAWKLVFGLPGWATRKVLSHRQHILSTMEKFRSLPKSERIAKGSSWPIETLLEEQDILGMTSQSNDTFLLLINWAANFNTTWICFWLLSHLLWRPNLMKEIKSETQKAISQGNIDHKILVESCPLLQSCIQETLRLHSTTITARGVSESIELSGKILEKGHKVLIPHDALHHDEELWGNDSHSFVADRFIRNASMTKHTAYRPFGGGTTHCPGRVIAKAQIAFFVALFLDQFESRLVNGQQFPEPDDTRPTLGTLGPKPNMDLRVLISRSEKSRFTGV